MKIVSFKYCLIAGLLSFTACSPDDIPDIDETISPPSSNVPEDNDDGDCSPVKQIVVTIIILRLLQHWRIMKRFVNFLIYCLLLSI